MSASDEPASLTLRLKHAERALRAQLAPVLVAEDLGLEHWQVLAVLLQEPGLRMTELAEAAVLPAATLTRHVDALVARALVVRRVDPADKRRVVVALSARGQAVAHRVRTAEQSAAALADAL